MSDEIKLPEPEAYQIAEIYEWEDGQAISGWNIADANSYRATMRPKRALYTAAQLRAAVEADRARRRVEPTDEQINDLLHGPLGIKACNTTEGARAVVRGWLRGFLSEQPARKPLTDDEIRTDYYSRSDNALHENNRLHPEGCCENFRLGVRFAERMHGVGPNEEQGHA